MSHKIIYCPEPSLYAIGGTVASCLTQDLPPEEPARVLSLGCGDPRSILFSVQCAKSGVIRRLPPVFRSWSLDAYSNDDW